MCFGGSSVPPPAPPPPAPPPPPTNVATAPAKAGGKRGQRTRKRQRGTLALTRTPRYLDTASGINLPT